MKPIVAVAGDRVVLSDEGMRVNGRLLPKTPRCSATLPAAASIHGPLECMWSKMAQSGWPPPTIAAATTLVTWVRSKYPRSARGSAHCGFSNLVSRRGRGRCRTTRLEGPPLGHTPDERMVNLGPVRLGRNLTYPEFALVRGDPRVKALRQKVGLPNSRRSPALGVCGLLVQLRLSSRGRSQPR